MSSGMKTVQDGDWNGIRRNFQRIGSTVLGLSATPTFTGLTLTGLTASRLVWTNSAKALASKDLVDLVAGAANEINITDDGSGGIIVGLIDPLIVAKGGTGVATLTDHGLLLGSGTSAVTPLGVAANGQIPIGSVGADPVLATLTGTTNQVNIANAAGSITLSTPQDIHTGASPTFAGLSLGTGELTCGSINRATGTLTLEVGGTAEISITSSASTFGGNIVIPNSGTIGSASDTDVMTIDASGNTTFSVFPITPSAAPDADYEVANKKYVDDNAEGTDEKCKVDSGATEDYLGAASSDGILRTGPSISYVDGGNYVTLNAIPGMFLDFYLSDTAEGVIATYYDAYDQPTGEAESTISDSFNDGDDQLLAVHITESGQPGIVELRAGIYSAHIHAAKTAGASSATLYWTLSTRTTGDAETVRMTSEVSGAIAGSNTEYELRATLATNVTINSTDRLVWKLYTNVAA